MTTSKTSKAIPAGQCACGKCGGSGLFHMGGAVVNGVYTGKIGDCFACGGKGWQTDADKKRCATYWKLNIARHAGLA